ncbi:iron-sulfur cluster biosynthesis family protein [Ornithinibacillus bavariensis]|uniref:Core domain-containing protein n=1 Tax=Ornithinibacillus bavariensis TaxID=545502 RepID=A0A919X9W2_9BACI|nr:iron-sulfur cluster biosynthesis family protein [Ornithinibacillus bavariensis]GIO28519.1 hypothetical protein J43TS3_31300 [Ornithinibacillus bavariensis]HAM81247.1 iron-sulfur cluster biosynthesis family protein [Ornithinibacillus sp.]
MRLSITDKAMEKIYEINQNHENYVMLTYDTKKMGCAVNGLPTFRLTNAENSNLIKIDNQQFPTFINEMQAVFFAEEMKLDFINSMFRLSSPEGILNPFIPVNSVLEND